jgi:hypothetical protein
MWRVVTALVLAIALPVSASAGPLKDAIEKAGRDLSNAQQQQETRNRGRFWTGLALVAGGGLMTTLGALEVGDDETGPDDGEDADDSDDGEDSDGWGNKALIGGGIAAAALGGILLFTGRDSRSTVSVRHGRLTVRHTVRF